MASLASSQRFEAPRKRNEVDWVLFPFLPRIKLKKPVDVELGCKRTMCTYSIPTGDLSHEEQVRNINVS